MDIKIIPIGQILALTFLIFLVGIGATLLLKKQGASSKIRKVILNSSLIGASIIFLSAVLAVTVYIGNAKISWSLYPWSIMTLKVINLSLINTFSVVLVVLIVLLPVICFVVLLKLFSAGLNLVDKFLDWHDKLTK